MEVAAEELESGVVEAKRTPTPFRIKRCFFEYCDLVRMLEIDAVFFERRGLAAMCPYCTLKEEN